MAGPGCGAADRNRRSRYRVESRTPRLRMRVPGGVPAGRHSRSCCCRASPSQGRPAAPVQAIGGDRPHVGPCRGHGAAEFPTSSSLAGPIARVGLGYCFSRRFGVEGHHHDTGRPRTGPPAAAFWSVESVPVGGHFLSRAGLGGPVGRALAPDELPGHEFRPARPSRSGNATLAGMVSSSAGTCRPCESW
jgi:hypothetical protein